MICKVQIIISLSKKYRFFKNDLPGHKTIFEKEIDLPFTPRKGHTILGEEIDKCIWDEKSRQWILRPFTDHFLDYRGWFFDRRQELIDDEWNIIQDKEVI